MREQNNQWREFLPEKWLGAIDQDPVLEVMFSDFSDEYEPVPPFLIQDLRGGNLEHLRPICALYGQPGLRLLEGLLEIDALTRDTAQRETPQGTAYAVYFFTRPEYDEQAAKAAARAYVHAINRIYAEELGEAPLLDEDAKIEVLAGREAQAVKEQLHQAWIDGDYGPDGELYDSLGDWFQGLKFVGDCQELGSLLSEPLYHISNDYNLSRYLQWPLVDTRRENPFRPYYDLWRMGLGIRFPARDRVVLME